MKHQKSILIAVLVLLITVLPASVLAQGGGEDYVVQAGDTLSKIAEARYGDLQAFPAIVEVTNQKAAEDDSYTPITNPGAIKVGQKIYIPSSEEAEAVLERNVSTVPAIPDVTPLPATAFGPSIDPAKGYLVEEVSDGLYWIGDGGYNMIFLTTGEGVIVVDAPPSIGENIFKAIAEVTNEPVTHLIYSHHHGDHIGAAALFSDDVTVIAHEETLALLERDTPCLQCFGPRPLPSVTFADSFRLEVGSQVLELEYRGVNHSPGNIFIYAPKQKVLMLVDVINPGWAPFRGLALAESTPGYIQAHVDVLSFDFDTFVGGHLSRLGTRADVETNLEYVLDVQDNMLEAMQTVDMNAIFSTLGPQIGFEHIYELFAAWHGELSRVCSEAIIAKWDGRLGDVAIHAPSHCEKLGDSLGID
jgi:glyoxylase-like metal-dependent hydrolase (beta-lactamase superfamily II)